MINYYENEIQKILKTFKIELITAQFLNPHLHGDLQFCLKFLRHFDSKKE